MRPALAPVSGSVGRGARVPEPKARFPSLPPPGGSEAFSSVAAVRCPRIRFAARARLFPTFPLRAPWAPKYLEFPHSTVFARSGLRLSLLRPRRAGRSGQTVTSHSQHLRFVLSKPEGSSATCFPTLPRAQPRYRMVSPKFRFAIRPFGYRALRVSPPSDDLKLRLENDSFKPRKPDLSTFGRIACGRRWISIA